MTPQPIGAFIIVMQNNQILLGKRKNSYKAGMYGCPGGRLEIEESLEASAARELFEETNLTANHLEYLGVIRERQDGYNFIHFAYLCKEVEGTVHLKEPDKCESWNFYNLNSLPTPILPGHQAGIDMLTSGKSLADIP